MKKILALVLALMMIMGLATTAFATGVTITGNGTNVTGTLDTSADDIYDTPSYVWVNTDGVNLYIFYETSTMESKRMYFHFGFGTNAMNSGLNKSIEMCVNLAATEGKWDKTKANLFEDFAADTVVNRFRGKSGENYAAGNEIFDGMDMCLKLTKDGDTVVKKSVEFVLPLPEQMKLALLASDVNLSMSLWERSDNPTNNGGLVASEAHSWSTMPISDPIAQYENVNIMLAPWIEADKTRANYDALKELKVNVIGDAMLAGGDLITPAVWTGLLQLKYGWDMTNDAQNNNLVSSYNGIDSMNIAKRVRSLPNNAPAIVIVSGGYDDFLHNVPLGDIKYADPDTFAGAMNAMFDSLRQKYKDAIIVYTTPWNGTAKNELDLTVADYAAVAEQVCAQKAVYCFKAYDPTVSGVDMTNDTFRANNCMAADNVANLNLAGMKLVMPKYEDFLKAAVEDWATNKDAKLEGIVETPKEPEEGGDESVEDTDAETDPITPDTDEKTTDDKTTEENKGGKDDGKKKGGCGSSITGTTIAVLLAIVAAAAVACIKFRKTEA